MCGLVGEEALSVFSSWRVIGDAVRNMRHGSYRVFSRQGEEVSIRLVAYTQLEMLAFALDGEPLLSSVFLCH